MAEVVRAFSFTNNGKDSVEVVWTGLLNLDSGQAVDLAAYRDASVQVSGTFGGATMTLYWSNETTAVKTDRAAGTLFGSKTANWIIAQDSLGNNIAKTAAGGDVKLESGHWFLPVISGGDGTTSLKVTITAGRNRI